MPIHLGTFEGVNAARAATRRRAEGGHLRELAGFALSLVFIAIMLVG